MTLNDKQITEFSDLWLATTGEKISNDKAFELAAELLNFVKLIIEK